MSKSFKKMLSKIGTKGGNATKEKYGNDHYRNISAKRWAKETPADIIFEDVCEECEGFGSFFVSPAQAIGGEIHDEVTEKCKKCSGSGKK